MTSDITKARAEHTYNRDRIRPEDVHELDLLCSQCGHVWEGIEEDGIPEPCIREDCKAPSEQIVRA